MNIKATTAIVVTRTDRKARRPSPNVIYRADLTDWKFVAVRAVSACTKSSPQNVN